MIEKYWAAFSLDDEILHTADEREDVVQKVKDGDSISMDRVEIEALPENPPPGFI